MSSKDIVIIGAGLGGLTTGAVLSAQGHSVTVLEAHIYPGGVAGTFYHQGFRFDVGATLGAGFYSGGPMDLVAQSAGVDQWSIEPLDPAMMVHLPDRAPIALWQGRRRWEARREAFGAQANAFWRWQEGTAEAMWDLALHLPPWPPQSLRELAQLSSIAGRAYLGSHSVSRFQWLRLIPDALRTVEAHLPDSSPALRTFIDAQLLISAQATASSVNALYGAAALDLPRRGVAQPIGGMGTLAEQLTRALERCGGQVLYRHRAKRIIVEDGKPIAVETHRHGSFPADIVVANLPAWNIAQMLGGWAPHTLSNVPLYPDDGWGAFTLYVGLDAAAAEGLSLHHQIVTGRGWGEGDSIYLSLSPEWDESRAPTGRRSATLSTHTAIAPWRELQRGDRQHYEARRDSLTRQMLAVAERAIPGLREAAEVVLPGTPATFSQYTGRPGGWVGGYPQTSLFRTRGARVRPGVWMVGDSIFPGQSVAATALSGLRVGRAIHSEIARGERDSSARLFRGWVAASKVIDRSPMVE